VAVSVLDIQVNSQGAVRSLNQVGAASNAAESAFRKLDGVFGSLAASFAAGFAINKIISDVKELDTNIRRLGTVGVDVQKINPALATLSERLGGVASKAELAAASYQAASAGFADTAGNIKILEAATKAATGGLADNQAVTEVLVKTLNAYGMSGTQAYEVTDSISKAVELGNQEWSDYTSQLGRVVSMAALAGVSLDEMNAFIAAATKNGATAEVAFTGLSAVLTQLLQPTKESKDAAAKLNVQWNLMGLQTKGLGGLMKELAVAIDKDKESAARMVGPTEAMRGAFAAASKDGKDFEGILKQLGDASGKTDADFTTMKGSLENTFKALDTSFKNLSEALAKAFGPTLVIVIQDITKGVNGFATAMSAVPQPVMEAVGTIIKVTAQIILLQKALEGIIALRAAFTAAMASMATTTATAGAAATASSSAFALYTANTKTLAAAATAATPQVAGLLGTIKSLAAIGAIVITVDLIVKGIGDVIAATKEIMRLRGIRAGGGAAAQFAGASRETVVGAQKDQRKILAGIQRSQKANQLNAGQKVVQTLLGGLSPLVGLPDIGQQTQRSQLYKEQAAFSQGVLGLDPNKFKPSTPAAKPTTTPPPTPTGGSGSKPKKDTAADEAARLKNALGGLGIEYSLKKQIYGIDNKIFEANLKGDKSTAIRLEGEKKLAEINASIAKLEFEKLKPLEKQGKIASFLVDKAIAQRDTQQQLITNQVQVAQQAEAAIRPLIEEGELLKAKLGGTEQQYQKELLIRQILKDNPTLRREEVTAIVEKNQALQQQLTQAEQLKAVYSDIGMTIKSGVVDAIQGAVDGTKSLGEVAASVLNNIANKILDVAVNMALFGAMSGTGTGGGLLGGFFKPPGKALGGPVSAGTPYMVGERGPELFMPSRGGSIIPNNALGGGSANVVVNVDASGSSVQGDQAQGRQLGVAISAAVQAELVKQQRPGGLLAGNRR
jgi:TP901 family phage tail tape measure protein